MRTFVLEGKPKENVTITIGNNSITLTKDVEVSVTVVDLSPKDGFREFFVKFTVGETGNKQFLESAIAKDIEDAREIVRLRHPGEILYIFYTGIEPV